MRSTPREQTHIRQEMEKQLGVSCPATSSSHQLALSFSKPLVLPVAP
jgi:hypothetical protein